MSAVAGAVGDTLLAYSSVKPYQDIICITKKMIASLENVKGIAELRLNAGLSSSSDGLQAASRVAALNTTLEQYRNKLDNAKANLAQLTGKNVDYLADLPVALLHELPQKQNMIDYGSIPSVRSAIAQEKAADAVLGATKAHTCLLLALMLLVFISICSQPISSLMQLFDRLHCLQKLSIPVLLCQPEHLLLRGGRCRIGSRATRHPEIRSSSY
jgi:hypothetical protein